MSESKRPQRSVRVDADLVDALSELAERTQRPMTFYLNECIKRGFDLVAVEFDLEQRSLEMRAGKVEAITLAEVKAEHGLGS